jgi:hypothetical protein
MEVKFGDFIMNPPRNNPKHKIEVLPKIQMYAIHVSEMHPPGWKRLMDLAEGWSMALIYDICG